MKLYEHPGSGNSHKVRLLLSFLDLDYASRTVALLEGEQNEEWFREINPRGEVPVLEDRGHRFRDSHAMLIDLSREHDEENRWLPTESVQMGKVMEWLAVEAGEIQWGFMQARSIVTYDWPAPVDLDTAHENAETACTMMEQRLSEYDWLVEDRATIADVACFPYVALAHMADFSLDPYPGIQTWLERFAAHSPHNQKAVGWEPLVIALSFFRINHHAIPRNECPDQRAASKPIQDVHQGRRHSQIS